MIYLTTDALEQGVYFDFRSHQPLGRGTAPSYVGLLGNGVHEVPVQLKRYRGSLEVIFGNSELFRFVDEEMLRGMVQEVVTATIH
ncbi:hypothetical protein [Geomesophilobacter sediminis]|uniref:Uncharacterized protein n=1 Tax=Geomesophilobacter sediminis TaxID=2798584 RepID=A0A8J7M333_9BACT|nr:hypothetical protein [Geomesophilobacter sediminis]MBJ6727368.1 hypothetical protein [Geomesophilobacter sediminis]